MVNPRKHITFIAASALLGSSLLPMSAQASSSGAPAPQESATTTTTPGTLAGQPSGSSRPAVDVPDAVNNLLQSGEEVIASFDAGHSYQGYVVDIGDRDVILYYDPEARIIFTGYMLDSEGNNLSEGHRVEYVPNKDYSEELSALRDGDSYITEGSQDAPAEIYVFFDPQCPHCHSFWQASRNAVDSGRLRINWLPVAFVSPQSLGKVASFMQSDNPVEVMNRGESSYDSGGLVPLRESAIDDDTRQAVDNNMLMMGEFDSNATPTIVFTTPSGNVDVINGSMPESDLDRLIERISENDSGNSESQSGSSN